MRTKKDQVPGLNDAGFVRFFIGILVLCGTSYLCAVTLIDYQYPGSTVKVDITGSSLTFTRSEHLTLTGGGGNNASDLYKSLGWMHARDRYVQMCIMRLASQGLLTDMFPYTDYNYRLDVVARQFNYNRLSKENIRLYDPDSEAVTILQSYVDGINAYIDNNNRPYEFMLLNYHPVPFTKEDVLTFIRFISYVGLDEVALMIERYLLKFMLSGKVSNAFLRDSFGPHLDNLTSEDVEMYKKIKGQKPRERVSLVPAITNSNNWVVSGKLSRSGMPIMSSDPHLDVIKQPNTFYESQYIGDGDNAVNVFGISVPGIPLILMGRNADLAFTFTYGMMDMGDYFVENIKNKHYERDGDFLPLVERVETIAGRKVIFYETVEGHVMERNMEDHGEEIEDGLYLGARLPDKKRDEEMCWRQATIPFVRTVSEAQKLLPQTFLGSNYLFADTQGNIGYQQTGSVPLRPIGNGLLPLPAWNSSNLWTGYLSDDDYLRVTNPPENFIATANNYLQDPKKPPVITFPAFSTRVNRISALLRAGTNYSVEDMKEIQADTYSTLAQLTIPLIDKYLPRDGIGEELRNWDRRFRVDSRPAALFHDIWDLLTFKVNHALFGEEWTSSVTVFIKYAMYKFTIYALERGGIEGHALEPILNSTMTEVLGKYKGQVYGDVNKYQSKNMFFDGMLPSFLGMDFGPYPASSGIEVVKVGGTEEYNGAPCHFSQTWKFVTDMSSHVFYSVLPGGPSGNYFSNLYGLEIHTYLNEQYKKWLL